MSEVLQRWRLVFARGEEAQFLSHLDAVRLWERAFRRGDIPVARSEGFSPRPKLVFASPLQLGMLAEHELADLFLAERLTAPDLRNRLAAAMPHGYRVVDLHDVWIGAPAIAPQLAAADYRMTLLNVNEDELAAAAVRLMSAEKLQRERHREAKTINYDLRPLILDVQARPADSAALPPDAAPGPAAGIWMRLRHSQNLGSGRADEVVAALAEVMGRSATMGVGSDDAVEAEAEAGAKPESAAMIDSGLEAGDRLPSGLYIEAVRPVRERLWLAGELD